MRVLRTYIPNAVTVLAASTTYIHTYLPSYYKLCTLTHTNIPTIIQGLKKRVSLCARTHIRTNSYIYCSNWSGWCSSWVSDEEMVVVVAADGDQGVKGYLYPRRHVDLCG